MTARAGNRRYQITVEEHDGTVRNGEPQYEDEHWRKLCQPYATYRGVSGGEVVRGRQIEADATGLLEILYTPTTKQINPQMRIRLEGRTLNIVSAIDPDGRKRELMVQVKEQANV